MFVYLHSLGSCCRVVPAVVLDRLDPLPPPPGTGLVSLNAGRVAELRTRIRLQLFASRSSADPEETKTSPNLVPNRSKSSPNPVGTVMDFNVKKLASDAGVFFTRAVQVEPPGFGFAAARRSGCGSVRTVLGDKQLRDPVRSAAGGSGCLYC